MRFFNDVFRAALIGILVSGGLLLSAQASFAHAILVEATPTPNSKVAGPDVAIRLKFNSRIDSDRSRLTLALPDGSTRKLDIQPQKSPDTLTSQASGLNAGTYKIKWQVLAVDGHVTRGELSFEIG